MLLPAVKLKSWPALHQLLRWPVGQAAPQMTLTITSSQLCHRRT